MFDVIYNMNGVLMGFWLVAGVVALREETRAARA